MSAKEDVQREYDRCSRFVSHPEEAPPLYGVRGLRDIRLYYTGRVEGLGFALDAMSREERELRSVSSPAPGA